MTARHLTSLLATIALAGAGLAGAALASTPTTTTTKASTTKATTTTKASTQPPPYVSMGPSNASAGKKLFVAQQCGSCHIMAAANQYDGSGVGPDLDHVTKTYAQIVTQITEGGSGMSPYGKVLSSVQINDLAYFIYLTSHSG